MCEGEGEGGSCDPTVPRPASKAGETGYLFVTWSLKPATGPLESLSELASMGGGGSKEESHKAESHCPYTPTLPPPLPHQPLSGVCTVGAAGRLQGGR